MCRVIENVPHGSAFHHSTGIHNHDPVAHFRHDAEIMGDEDDGQAGLILNFPQQAQVLGLNGHVERGGGLISNNHVGLT